MSTSYCSSCGSEFDDELGFDRCPRDGEPLLPTPPGAHPATGATRKVDGGGVGGAVVEETCRGEAPAGISEVTGEIEDLIFKVCNSCHTSYGSDVDVCPHDGTRLSEPSMVERATLFLGTGDFSGTSVELKKYCPSCKSHFALHNKVCSSCGGQLEIPTLGGSTIERGTGGVTGGLIADKYRLIGDIGAGGFGSVYLAKHESLGKRYAVKVLRAQLSETTDFRNRFHEEALKLSRLEDENIVKVIDFGEWRNLQYMVTEYIEGQDLGALIYAERADPLRAARIMQQVAAALAEAHSKKIVHLDLKPANILVTRKRGRDIVKVIDFGIAEIYSETRKKGQEILAGTCTYMPPEQWRRERLDPRADIYSFGVILYEFLAGRPPFRSDRVSGLEKAHCNTLPPPLRKLRPDVPAELERIAHRCLEKKPDRRFRSAEELEAVIDGYVRRTENVLTRWLRRIAVAAALLALLAAGAWALHESWRDKESPELSVDVTGNALVEVAGPAGTRVYRTRDGEVVLRLSATDNREFERFLVDLGDGKGETSVSENPARLALGLRVGKNPVSARAIDGAGNSSAPEHVTLERLLPGSVRARVDDLPTHTRLDRVELEIEGLTESTARVICLNGEKRLLDRVVVEPARVVIPLERGENTIEVHRKDRLGGDESLVSQVVVAMEDRPPVLQAVVSASPRVVELRPGVEWLTAEEEVELEVRVAGARERLPDSAELRYRLGAATDTQASPWEEDELDEGRKVLRVSLLEEGRNDITIEPVTDRYENRSGALTLLVHRDRTAPAIEVLSETIEYFEEDLPPIRFRLTDRHPGNGFEGVGLVELAGDSALSRDQFRVERGEQGLGTIQILDPSLVARDGRHGFRITARDLAGNETDETTGRFTVLADHGPPGIVVVGPPAGHAFRRGEEVKLSVRADDAFAESLKVAARLTVVAPGRKPYEKSLPLTFDPVDGIWKGILRVGAGEIEKPRAFGTLEPGFEVTCVATDRAGHSAPARRRLDFAWENGDQLLWRDGSVLIYHEACRARNVPAFFMARTEVTNEQYGRFLAALGGKPPRSPDWRGGRCAGTRLGFPVRGISPEEALAYARWAKLALPRRDQWQVGAFWDYEKTAWRRYPWSDGWPARAPPPLVAGKRDGGPVAATGSFAGGNTPLGLEHMFGNVWELVTGGENGEFFKVGGGYATDIKVFRDEKQWGKYLRGEPLDARPVRRDDERDDLGFRCVLALKGSPP